jgi:hypothetical protein
MTSVRRVLLETLAPAGGAKAQDRIPANPDGTLTVTPDASDWGSPIDQLSSADSPTGFLEEEHGVPHFCCAAACVHAAFDTICTLFFGLNCVGRAVW